MPKLTISAADETTEIFVVASDFALRGRGARQLSQDLETGIYKVRAVSGRTEWQRVIALRADTTIDVPQIAFGSAAPLSGTSRTHESHMAAAEQATPPPEAPSAAPPGAARSLGFGPRAAHDASFTFMARWWTPQEIAGPTNLGDPARGASLATRGGRRLMRLKAPGLADGQTLGPTGAGPHIASEATWFAGDRATDRYSGVALNADAGLYTLRLSDGDGSAEQTITLLPGWRTTVFALYEPPVDEHGIPQDGGDKRLVDVSIHISRGALSMDDDIARMTDAARLALADERSSASGDLLKFVRGKYQNPMLGLYGAHLLLLLQEKKSSANIARPVDYDAALFREVLDNTARLFGDDHPDIVALRDLDADPPTLGAPPMLWRSWVRLLDASVTAPALVPPSLWRRTALRSQARPFFAWRVPQYGGDRIMRREIELTRAVLLAAADRERLLPEARGLRTGQAPAAIRDDFIKDCVQQMEAPRSVLDMIL